MGQISIKQVLQACVLGGGGEDCGRIFFSMAYGSPQGKLSTDAKTSMTMNGGI